MRFTDREPARLNDTGDLPFGWYDQDLLDGAFPGEGPHEYGLPHDLFALLPDPILTTDGRLAGLNRYKDSAAAHAAASRAALAWAAGAA